MKLPRLLATLTVLALCGALHAEVVVIVHRGNPVATMTADQVAQIYMGASTTFPGGGAAAPIDQPEGSAVRDEFLAKVLEKTGAQFKAVWSRLIFSGKGTRPKTLGGSAEVKKAVGSDPAAIGFIERSALDDSVRLVLGVK
jgi:ABC-type phosphate transport system substrate-binding protein